MPKLFTRSGKKNNFIKKKPQPRPWGAVHNPLPVQGTWRPLPMDKPLAFITFAFVLFGLIFTYSSSAFDSISYFQRQVLFDILGIASALFLWQFYDKLQKLWIFKPIHLMYVTWLLLTIVLFTKPIANVHRWIDLGVFNLQPSEIAKVTLVIYVADYLSTVQGKLSKNWMLMIKPLVVTAITLGLILIARDFGTPALMTVVIGAMLFAAGAKIKHLAVPVLIALPVAVQQLLFVPYRRERLFSFLNPEADPGGIGYQLTQSFMAVGSGGWFGKGLGNSELKLEYLPAAHTDFIFSIMCEEVGLLGAAVLLAFFCWLLVRGISLARVARNNFNSLLIFGLTITICVQAFINMAMAIGLMPTKGIALPFFSYGGSSVIMTLVMMGILLNMAASDSAPKTPLREDFTHYKTRNR